LALFITRMVGLIAFVRPDSKVMGEKINGRNNINTYQIFGTTTNPATETESMGLPADALAVKFFAAPFTKFTLTRQFRTIYHDLQKTRQP
jgi:hypothetical protein